MARLLDLSPQRLRKLYEEGVIPRKGPGRWNPFAVTVAYIRWLKDQRAVVKTEDDESARLARETRRQKHVLETESLALDNLAKKKKFVFASDHVAIVKDLSVQVRTTIERAKFISKENQKRLIGMTSEIKPEFASAAEG